MQLTRLEIKGFKSFGDKITINFNEGITAIVGPNGCGKSNVVDAIRWVLGEQSTRMLRSEKMENIIFNGSKLRKASHLAEVSLSFDNTKNILPTEYSQVTITRKLYRSGESEYRLNDVQCRLKDITDLFLDTGIGSDSYAIIELRMIDEIINNKDHSRRSLFEEASGISKYKLRKKQTFSKLKDTEADLSRVDDLLFEIEKNLKTLENQAKKAERYLKLKVQYKEMSTALASFRIAHFSRHLEELEKQESGFADVVTQSQTQLNVLESQIQQQKLHTINKEKNLATQQKATNELIHKIRNYESEKKVKNEQLRFLQEKERKLKEEIEKDKTQQNHAHYNLKRLHEEELTENQNFENVKNQLQTLKTLLDEMRIQQQSEKLKVDELLKKSNDTQNEIYKTDKEIEVLNIQKQTLAQETARNIDETEHKTVELSAFATAIEKLEQNIHQQSEANEQLQEREQQIEEDLSDLNQKLQGNKEHLVKINRSIDAKQNEYQLTKSLVDSLEGYPESIRFLKKNTTWAKNIPLLSDILFCEEDYRVTIENYLDSVMNYYVTAQASEALQAINLLSDSSKGRANFFILEAFLGMDIHNLPAPEVPCIAALEVVDYDLKYANLCRHLLKNVYIITEQEEAVFQKNNHPKDLILLSKSGKYSSNTLSFSGGSVGLFEGKRIGRAKNIEALSKDIKLLSSEAAQLGEQNQQYDTQITFLKESSKKNAIIFNTQALQKLHTELITLQTKYEQYQSFITNSEHRKADISEKIAHINAQLSEMNPQLMRLNTLNYELKNEHAQKLEQYQNLADEVTEQNTKYNEWNLKFHQQQNKVNGIIKDIEYREVQLETIENRLIINEKEYATTQAQMLETLQYTDTDDAQLITMYQERTAMETALQEAENEYYQLKESINTQENELHQLRKNKEDAGGDLQNIKDKKNNLKLDFNSLKERLSIEFNIDIAELLDQNPPDDENEIELKVKVERLKKQLDEYGAVNPMAMEAYQEMSLRNEFINTQKGDLLAAKADLLETIKEIDDTAKGKFMEAFTQVRDNFILVFRSLFNEEDNCDLVLSDINNPLESDIDIIAKPKGKKPLSINQLSGGEKTLTSTALLFSLYLLKPAPFCIFDEVDAPLDDTNIDKFNQIIRKFSHQSQFIVVSHNKKTIASTDIIYGVTMVEQGVSRVVAVDMREM